MNMRLQNWQAWVFPLAGGFVLASTVVALVVPSHAHPLSWPGLISRSVGLIALAALGAVAAILLIGRKFRDHFKQLSPGLIACGWSAAIWLPLLLLLQMEHALWVMIAPVPMVAIVTKHTKRQVVDDRFSEAEEECPESTSNPLLRSIHKLQPERIATNAIVCALLLQACIAATAAGTLALAASLLILTTVCLAWGFTAEMPPSAVAAHNEALRRRASVLPCFLLTCLAMTPFLLAGSGGDNLGSIVLAGARGGHMVPTKSIMGQAYSGVVLLAAPLPKHTHLEVPHQSLQSGALRPGRPFVIPFDGAYWFFESPNSQPGSDSPIQRGDPLKNHVRSTNHLPLEMEAHQRLSERINTSCCTGFEIHLTNADNRLGAISVEAVLRDVRSGSTVSRSLGTVPIRSSQVQKISLYRAPVTETLRFSMSGADDFQFNEITLIFQLGRDRNQAGAEVKVNDFTLVP